jgi:hypothetical protein
MRAAEWESAEPAVVDDDAAPAVPAPAPQYHYILPSFLHLLKHLKESGLYTFTLVFRTFGQDLPHVPPTLLLLLLFLTWKLTSSLWTAPHTPHTPHTTNGMCAAHTTL